MSLIVRHIAYLLRNHDCVVVSGIGAFIAHRTNAYIDSDDSRIMPPQRTLGFNAEIGHDDGLLVSSVARQMEVTYQQAQKTVASEIDALRCQLVNNGEIALPRIGLLRREQDGRISFEPFANNVTSNAYLGLTDVRLSAVKAASTPHLTSGSGIVRPSVYRRWIQIAASIALLLCMGGLLSTPVDLSDAQVASLGISVTEPAEQEFTDFELLKVSPDARLNIAIPAEQCKTGRQPKAMPESDTQEHNYYLIVASLPSEQLAEKFIAADGNPALDILNKDGRYRVYAATGNTQAETMNYNTGEFAKRYPDAWVYAGK